MKKIFIEIAAMAYNAAMGILLVVIFPVVFVICFIIDSVDDAKHKFKDWDDV